MKKPITLSNKMARRLFLSKQGLADNPRAKQSKTDLLELIDRLGFVQVDSIRTVERAHHMILFARNQTYRPDHLTDLLEHDRHLFEHWTHDASIIPVRFFPQWRMRFKAAENKLKDAWITRVGREGFADELDHVINHIKDHGPALSRDLLKDEHRGAKPGWWNWHPRKTALEYLWRTGTLSISGRQGFQKVYDLSENVIPSDHHDPEKCPDLPEFVDWCCREALQRLGFATSGELAAFWDLISAKQAKEWVDVNQDDLQPVLIESADGTAPRQSFAFPDIEQHLDSIPKPSQQIRLLSPFDPVLRDRKRAKRLFNFDYRIEVFVPEAKRKYGYYVFPLLEGDRMIGRIDAKIVNPGKEDATLKVQGLWWEPGIKATGARQDRLEKALTRLEKWACKG